MPIAQPVLVVTDARDDLGRHCGVMQVGADGHLSCPPDNGLDALLTHIADAGVLVLARDASPAAQTVIGSLCALAREKKSPALLLRCDEVFTGWPSHPVSVVADIPAWLWLDARAAWTALLETCWHRRDNQHFFSPQPGRLRRFTGDRRAHVFLADLAPRPAAGILVPSILDDDAHKLNRADLSWPLHTVAGHRAGSHPYTQAWTVEPHEGQAPSTGTYQPLLCTDFGVDLCCDYSPDVSIRVGDLSASTGRALAALYDSERDFDQLARIVDVVVPRQPTTGDEAAPNAADTRRAQTLNSLLACLGLPPVWRCWSVLHGWDDEIEEADVVRGDDELGALRRRAGFEDDAEGAGPEDQICVIACDVEANRLLPALGWRRTQPVFSRQAFAVEREGRLRALYVGDGDADGPAAGERALCVVPCAEDGSPAGLFHVVRYGDRLPRRTPALIVALGAQDAVARVEAQLRLHDDGCGVPLLACARERETDIDFLSARQLLLTLQAWVQTRTDEVYPLDLGELGHAARDWRGSEGRAIEGRRTWLQAETWTVAPGALLQSAERIRDRIVVGRQEPAVVHVSGAETDVSRDELVAFFKSLDPPAPCARGASPGDGGGVRVAVWWRRS
ncbi:MAG: hypothetical protein Q8O67_31750 [Deltaproteobacteria bacterium]|nr:hypothetical protein [Deltaproteobacteria bacterium]